jgi:outer membrane immunogenic protein
MFTHDRRVGHRMKKIFPKRRIAMNKEQIALLAAAVILPGGVLAADLPAKAPGYTPAAAYGWSGFYAGAHGGYGWGANRFTDDATGVSGKYEPSGGFGGVQLGYNSQFAPHWLIGGEFDFSAGKLSDSGSFTGGTGRYKIDYFGTARTRFGYVQDRSLFYVTGGVAWMHDKSNNTGAFVTATDQYSVGWVAGGGWEWAIDNRWSAKIEYLYAGFDKTKDFNAAGNRRTFDANISTVKAGINYRLRRHFCRAGLHPRQGGCPALDLGWQLSWFAWRLWLGEFRRLPWRFRSRRDRELETRWRVRRFSERRKLDDFAELAVRPRN